MPQNKYDRLPHVGDFEQEGSAEVFYLSPEPVPTGMPAFSGQLLHQEASEVYLDVGVGERVSSLQFALISVLS